jgi:poly(A) polymerase/tRNA nucleotidyltransferase (CCA-adding enzyme)
VASKEQATPDRRAIEKIIARGESRRNGAQISPSPCGTMWYSVIMSLNEHTTATITMLASFCAQQQRAAWLVGGTARDISLQRNSHDIDVAVDGDGVALARLLADTIGGAFVPLDDERGTGRVVFTRDETRQVIDLVQLRAPTIEEDLRLRDFTINALALPLDAANPAASLDMTNVIDSCGGLDDITSRTLRPCLPTSLRDDPLRSLRAVRLAAELDLHISSDLDAAMRDAAHLIERVSAERVRDELLRLCSQRYAAPWLRYMDNTGLLTRIFPELEPGRDCEQPIIHFLPVLGHALEAVTAVDWLLAPLLGAAADAPPAVLPAPHLPVAAQTYPDLPRALPFAEHFQAHLAGVVGDGFPRTALLRLATLLHDNAKPQTKQPKAGGGVTFYGHQAIGADVARAAAQRLRLSRQSTAYIGLVVREHMRPGQLRAVPELTPRAVARFFRDTGEAGPDVLLHELADHLAARGPALDPQNWRDHLAWTTAMLGAHWGQPEERTRPLINGNDLMTTLKLKPGRQVGQLLAEIQEAQSAGEISTREQALDLAQQILAEQS